MPVRRPLAVCVATLLAAACRPSAGQMMSEAHRAAIADSLRQMVAAAYDFSKGDMVERLMSLYPDSGRVVSATAGRVSASRDTLEAGIRQFWQNVGRNMRNPRWTWGETHVEVLSPDAAVLTATYRIPHRTPEGAPHVIGGAWTAVFARRDGRWVIVHEHLSDAPAPR
jgi:ketosteroid isomerase-like protein